MKKVFVVLAGLVGLVSLSAWWLAPVVQVTKNLAYPDSHIIYDRGEPVSYKYNGVAYTAYLHKNPDESVKKVIVFGHGVVVDGALDTRLQHFANALAREGYAVLMPHTVDPARGKTSHGFSCEEGEQRFQALAGAVEHAADKLSPDGKVSLMSISAGSREAFRVASGPLASKIDRMHLIGGYSDLSGLLAYNMTGKVKVDGQWVQPTQGKAKLFSSGSPLRSWVMSGVLAGLEQNLYTEALRKHLKENKSLDEAELSGWPRAYQDLALFMVSKNPDEVQAAIPGLFSAVPDFSRMLACWEVPSEWLSGVRSGHVSVLTNDFDVAIPAVESAKIAKTFGARGSLHKTELLDHVGLITLADKWEQARRAWGLFTFVYTIVR